jgi:hypothetical protein
LKSLLAALLVVGIASVAPGCSGGRASELEAETLPSSAGADYALFALRCSKCHSLSRPLNSGIDRDDYWRLYVERMRRQPASGISEEDAVAILRFLHLYAMDQRRRKEQKLGIDPPQAATPAPDASTPTGTP